MAHLMDSIGYPQDPELHTLEFKLGNLAALWRSAHGDLEQQRQIVDAYHTILSTLYRLSWDTILDVESELPDDLMPEEYLRRNGRY